MTFADVTKEMTDLYLRKNHDYGNSFDQTMDQFGVVAGLVRLSDKMNRLQTLYKVDSQVKDEKIEDTLLDLANYAIMTYVWLKNCETNEN